MKNYKNKLSIILKILIFLFIILIINILFNKNKEGFLIFNQENAPWFRSSPSTRNMSLDLRCDPYIKKENYIYNKSTINPLPRCNNSCLDIRRNC